MNDKGIALVMTLWVLVLLTVIAMNLSFSTRHGSRSTRNFKEDSQAFYLATSAYEEALAYLVSDPDIEVDYIDKNGNFRTDNEREPITGDQKVGDTVISLKISDEESRFDININHGRQRILNLLDYVGIPEDEADEIADSIADWRDEDDLHHLLGAEDDYYSDFGYLTKDSEFDIPEELLLVKGITTDYYYGDKNTPSLHSIVTTWARGVNVNTVSEEVMSILGMDPVEIDSIISQREGVEGLRSVPPNGGGIALTKSVNFRIEVTARMKNNPMGVKLTSIVRRFVVQNGFELRTLYWKEGFEFESTRA